jgi:hypothetical protein
MARKSDEERLKELEEKMEQIKAIRLQLESRVKEKERKARTKRLIEVGAIFEKYFEIEGQEEAEKVALGFEYIVLRNKDKILKMSKEELEESNKKKREKKHEESSVK